MIHAHIEQGSPEWLALRAGKITGSRVADMMKRLKDGKAYAASRKDYAFDLALERITGELQGPDLSNVKHVQDGKDREAEARELYAFMRDVEVEQVGFATHDAIPFFGASPDGLIGDDGCLEIKCPKAKTHLEYLLGKVAPEDYIPQMDAEMACTGRAWCDFVSYHPAFPAQSQLFIVRYHRKDDRIAELEREVVKFNEEIEEIVRQIKAA